MLFSVAFRIYPVIVFTSFIGRLFAYEQQVDDAADFMVQSLIEKYNNDGHEQFWHPYVFGTGSENREVVKITDIEKIPVEGAYRQWKHAKLGLHDFFVGMTSNTLHIFDSDLKKLHSFESAEPFVAQTVFTKWNEEKVKPIMIIVVVTVTKNALIFGATGSEFQNMGEWPLNYEVKDIEFCRMPTTTKLLLIPKSETTSMEIYDIEINYPGSHLWFSQRLNTEGSQEALCYEFSPGQSLIAVAMGNTLHIYNFEQKRGIFTIHQEIELANNCHQLFIFSLAYKLFLGSVPTAHSFIEFFSFNGTYYTSEGNLGNHSAIDVFPLEVEKYRDEHFLFTQDMFGITHILSFNTFENIFETVYDCTIKNTCPPAVRLSNGASYSTHKDSTVYILPSDGNGVSVMLTISVTIETGHQSPIYKDSRDLFHQFQQEAPRVQRWIDIIKKIESTLETALNSENDNIITGVWEVNTVVGNHINLTDTFTHDKFTQPGSINSEVIFDITKVFKFHNETWSQKDFDSVSKFPQLNDTLHSLQAKIVNSDAELNDALLKNFAETQVVKLPTTVTGHFSSSKLKVEEAWVHTMWTNENATEFLAGFALQNKPNHIKGTLFFDQNLQIHNLAVDNLNGVNPLNIAHLSQTNTINCPVVFQSKFTVSGDIQASAVGGHNFATEIVKVDDIQGCNFEDGLISNNTVLEDVHFNYNNILLKSKDQRISGPIHFEEIILEKDSNVNLLNSVPFKAFADSVVLQGYEGTIRGHKTTSGVISTQRIERISTLNSIPFPDGYVQDGQKEVICTGEKHFLDLKANEAIVHGLINRINISEKWVGLSQQLDLNSEWTFKNMVSTYKLTVLDKIDGVSTNDLKHSENFDEHKDNYAITDDVEFANPVYFKDLTVASKFNNKTFTEMFGELILFNGEKCRVPGTTIIQGSLQAQNMHIDDGRVNSVLLNSIATLNTEQNFTGHVSIWKETRFSNLQTSYFDSVDLSTMLTGTIRLSSPDQTVDSPMHFENLHVEEKFSAHGAINNMAEFGTKIAVLHGRPEQAFRGQYKFSKLEVEEMDVKNTLTLYEGKTIGGVDLEKWFDQRIDLTKPQNITQPITIYGNVGALELQVGKINGVTPRELDEHTLRNDRAIQNFTEYTNATTIKTVHVKFNGLLNKHSLDEIKRNAFPLWTYNAVEITGNWTFNSVTVNGNLQVHDKTCGVNLQHLNKDSVKKNETDVHIGGDKRFLSQDVVKQILNFNKLNGMDNYFHNLVTLKTEQTIQSHIIFDGNLRVTGQLIMNSINGVELKKLCDVYSFENGNTHIFKENVTLLGNLAAHNLQVDNYINGAHVTEMDKIVKKHGDTIHIHGRKTFTEPVKAEKSFNATAINGVHLHNLFQNVIMTNRPYTFLQPVSFMNIETSQMHIHGCNLEAKYVNGDTNIQYLYDNAVFINGQSRFTTTENRGNFHFVNVHAENGIHTTYLNGNHMNNYVTLHTEQDIAHLSVDNAEFSGPHVPLRGHIAKKDLSREYENTLMNEVGRDQYVTGPTYFMGYVTVEGDLECTNDPHIRQENIVTLQNDHTVHGPIVFERPIYVYDMEVTGTVSGYTLDQYLAEPLTYNSNQDIPSNWQFDNVTFQEGIHGTGRLDNYDVKKIRQQIIYNVTKAMKLVEGDLNDFRQQCFELDDVTRELAKAPMKLDSFDTSPQKVIFLDKTVERIITLSTKNQLFLLASVSTCEILMYSWNYEKEMFDKLIATTRTEHRFGLVKDWDSVTSGEIGILVYTTRLSGCSPVAEGLYSTTLKPVGPFTPIQTMFIGSVSSFKVVKTKNKNIFLFAIAEAAEQSVIVQIWNDTAHQFQIETIFFLKPTIYEFEAIEFQHGIVCILQTRFGILTYFYDRQIKMLTLVATTEFSVKTGSSMIVFENYGLLYAVAQEVGAVASIIKPSCGLQVFRFYDGIVERFQDLPVDDDLILNSMQLYENEILISRISKIGGIQFYRFMGLSGLQLLHPNPIKIFDAKQIHFFSIQPWVYKSHRPFFLLLRSNTITVFDSNVYGNTVGTLYQDSLDICLNS